ncbi:MAG: hypothetical protein WD851_09705 [Pirellulales bacterium]
MSLHLIIPDPLAKGLEARAEAEGSTAEQVALSVIERELKSSSYLGDFLAPVRKAYEETGMTEDESFDFLEAEKHALRRECRAAQE